MEPALRVLRIVAMALMLAACTDREAERLRATTKATYDRRTGRLVQLTSDVNHNGRIDTWTEMDGSRPIRSRTDRDEDGRIDRWEYYDPKGQLLKVGFSRSGDEKPDAWAFSDDRGNLSRVEISSTGDESKIDRWEHYEASRSSSGLIGPMVSAEEDSNGDGKPDRWETYEYGTIRTLAFDEDFDGRPDRRLTYSDSVVTLIETEPDATGRYTKRLEVDQ
jgi:hypothetical protein